MSLPFRHHDALRLFIEVSRYPSFSAAAQALNLTKGAISYQIKTLETDLGVSLFRRGPTGAFMTEHGQEIVETCRGSFDDIEDQIRRIRGPVDLTLTVGVSTYFASRWLSSRLMSFMQMHPKIQLRLQPMIRLFDLETQKVDIAIRWGNGRWDDVEIKPFMSLPAFPVGNAEAKDLVQSVGMETAMRRLTLLRDHDDSNAWTDWLNAADLPNKIRPTTLIVPDPNVRVQAVINGQGIALMDQMIAEEIETGTLFVLSDIKLADYGYFVARPRRAVHPDAVDVFVEWLSGLL